MPFNLDEYKKWADEEKKDDGKPCIHSYLRHLIYKDANSEPKHTKNEYQPLIPMVIPE